MITADIKKAILLINGVRDRISEDDVAPPRVLELIRTIAGLLTECVESLENNQHAAELEEIKTSVDELLESYRQLVKKANLKGNA